MFATLVGTNTRGTEHAALLDRLCGIANDRGFVAPDSLIRIQPDGPVQDWSLEQRGPRNEAADFLLAVTAPRVPGISPIFTVFKTIPGPLFAVVILESAFVVSREDRRDVSEVKDADSVVASFGEFLDGLPERR